MYSPGGLWSTSVAQIEAERPALPMKGPDFVWFEWQDKRPQAVSSRFKAAARRAGFGDLRLHDLRHGFCSRLAQARTPLPTIGELAGHESVQTTARYASHLPDGAKESAIRAMQDAERAAAEKRLQADA